MVNADNGVGIKAAIKLTTRRIRVILTAVLRWRNVSGSPFRRKPHFYFLFSICDFLFGIEQNRSIANIKYQIENKNRKWAPASAKRPNYKLELIECVKAVARN